MWALEPQSLSSNPGAASYLEQVGPQSFRVFFAKFQSIFDGCLAFSCGFVIVARRGELVVIPLCHLDRNSPESLESMLGKSPESNFLLLILIVHLTVGH